MISKFALIFISSQEVLQKHQEPAWQTPISRSQVSIDSGGIQLSKKNALLNDAVTTTTTVEVFRAPIDGDNSMISLTPSPFGGTPLLVRAHGPQYEQWNDRKVQTMMTDDDRRDLTKGVQWKERLIEESDRRFRDSGSEFYDEIADPPQFIHHDYRPKPSAFQTITHPIVMTGSRDDLRSQPPPYPAPLSPLYIVPDRHRTVSNSVSPGQWSRKSNGYQDERGRRDGRRQEPRDEFHRKENEQNQNRERYQHRRSKSSTRDDASSHRSLRHRSMSPASRRSLATSIGGSQEFVIPIHSPIGSTLMLASPDPNELPGRPASAKSQEIFALYQTRDAYNRIVDQL
ncbi:hypothetical protein CAEBREN_23509 [Caenorhabditis brenneri]|uniref:Uncharacterized protein n=1 Tax=Caenorhabditis brenneri TaxID=135651 RepID=G0NZ48_CAEBE|nr:hypothetical protein CAEBREN_23509 [Caenorhabditis brenneri]